MQEVFYEESSISQSQKSGKIFYYILFTMGVISFILGGIYFILNLLSLNLEGNVLLSLLFLVIPTALFVAFGVVCIKFKNSFCIDYDYTFVTGTIRIAKVIKQVKRKFLVSFEAKEIEMLGRFASDTYFTYAERNELKAQIFTSNKTETDGYHFNYFVVNSKGEKNIYIIECTDTFLKNVIKFAGRNVIEKDFGKGENQSKN